MRLGLMLAGVLAMAPGPVFAQDWTEFASREDRFTSIYVHENRLYIMEGTVPDGMPEPGLFQQSLGWRDENGGCIRYSGIYLHGAPKPARTR